MRDYFVQRSVASGISRGGNRLAAVALTGHMCDITMGMVLVPISRHSALASFFKMSVSTTLTNHMLTAYTLFILVLIHAFLYVSWVPVFNSLSNGLRMVIPVLNPTYLYNEVWPGSHSSLGIWRASLIFTGIVAVIIMAALSITTLPAVRKKHFNLFYFTHLFSIAMVVIICLHASTMFYCTAPGLAMWFLDWGMRIYELRKVLDGDITTIGNGWYWHVCRHDSQAQPNEQQCRDPSPSITTYRLFLPLPSRPLLHPPRRLLHPRTPPFHNHNPPRLQKLRNPPPRRRLPYPIPLPQTHPPNPTCSRRPQPRSLGRSTTPTARQESPHPQYPMDRQARRPRRQGARSQSLAVKNRPQTTPAGHSTIPQNPHSRPP